MSRVVVPDREDVPIRRILGGAAAVIGLVGAVVFACVAVELLLLIFAAVLVAQLLLALTDALRRWTGLPHGWALASVCLALGGLSVLGGSLLAPSIAEQARGLAESLPGSLEQARAMLRASRVGAWLGDTIPSHAELKDMLSRAAGGVSTWRRVTGVLTTTVGAVASAVLVAFLGLFFAAQPRTYHDGLVRLVPPDRRARAREVLGRVGQTLRWWLLGKALSMTLVGTLSALGLWLLGIPLALTLGLIAALLGFVPNFGPVIAVVPAVLIALSHSAASAGYVLLLYLGIQTVESYVITPLVQQRTVSLAPGLLLGTQMVVGGLLGALGLALSTPMLAAAVVLVETLYVEDVLHDDPRE